jgi:transposase-like protein
MERLQVAQTRKRYTEEFRRLAVERMKGCADVSALSRELGVGRNLLYKWRARLEGPAPPVAVRGLSLKEENRQLKQLLAERTLEVDFFKGALQKIRARRQQNADSGAAASTPRCGR